MRAYDRDARRVRTLGRAECGFGYRTSRFKRDEARRLVVLSVTFQLSAQALSAPVRYAELAAALGVEIGDRVPAGQARAAVIALLVGRPALARGRVWPPLLARRLAVRRLVAHIPIHGPNTPVRLMFGSRVTNR